MSTSNYFKQFQAFLQKIITIQAVWRGALVRVNLRKLKTNPTFPVIKKFSAVLQNSITSYEKELVLQVSNGDYSKR